MIRAIDLQVNGYLACDYSSLNSCAEEMYQSAHAMLQNGCTAFLPTIITSAQATYERNLPLLATMCQDTAFAGALPGLHVEGPFLCPSPGAIGAHNPEWVRTDADYLHHMQELADGCIILLTIAADHPQAVELCQIAAELNIVVSLGHHNAGADDLQRCVDAGAIALTHLGNGVASELPRHENPIWAGLANDHLQAMMIADGHHVPLSVLKAMIRAKGVERSIIVSDASPIAGMVPGKYETLGNKVVLEESGLLWNPDKGCLVGSSATMNDCIHCMLQAEVFSEQDIQCMVWQNPLKLMSLTDNFMNT
ncbi:MAG: hypothetical protein HRU15_16585 [Planctomycetes bacterium]|nr:hypothetical protein [Planctomycetota bacterium]